MHSNVNRVYVNPNFNRVPNRDIYTSDTTYPNNSLHVNPNFTRDLPNIHQNINSHSKIYVNPNFIKSTNILEINKLNGSTSNLNNFATSLDYSNSVKNKFENGEPYDNIPIQISSKSRYHLVRKNDNKVLAKECQVQESCTIKINKYKSIPLINFKNNLQFIKNEKTFNKMLSNGKPNTLEPQYINRGTFKIVRHNSKQLINTPPKLSPKYNSIKSKKYTDLKLQLKLKVSIGARKKNNIPCRLFTKYGKCLRNLYGTCKYLHDKKHLSVCRKFIKGICHDKECLLSHELSSKKMPTCYFYLRGMCTKDDCPYLHVKLNEKSNICREFLKGYCDKGDKCLQRHVRPQTAKISNKESYALNKQKIKDSSNINITKSVINHRGRSVYKQQSKRNTIDAQHQNKVPNEGDCRYFKDLLNEESTCEFLKPTRCKLGTLPSYIHL